MSSLLQGKSNYLPEPLHSVRTGNPSKQHIRSSVRNTFHEGGNRELRPAGHLSTSDQVIGFISACKPDGNPFRRYSLESGFPSFSDRSKPANFENLPPLSPCAGTGTASERVFRRIADLVNSSEMTAFSNTFSSEPKSHLRNEAKRANSKNVPPAETNS